MRDCHNISLLPHIVISYLYKLCLSIMLRMCHNCFT